MDAERRHDLEHRRLFWYYTKAVRRAITDLEQRGLSVGMSDALPAEAAAAAVAALDEQRRFHLVWHRVWGVRLRSEVVAVCRRLAADIGDEPAMLIWDRQAGLMVPAGHALHVLCECIGPEDGDASSDLLLVADDGDSGLHLEYSHLSSADEYELRSWGRFARPTS